MLIEQRVSLKKIQKLMGHSDIKTTMNYYGHLIERVDEKNEEKFSMISAIRKEVCGKSVARKSELMTCLADAITSSLRSCLSGDASTTTRMARTLG